MTPTPILPFLVLSFCMLFACSDTTQPSEEIGLEAEVDVLVDPDVDEVEEQDSIPLVFERSIRPNEKVDLGKVYMDTVIFREFNDDGDYWLLFAEKNSEYFSLICNDGYDFLGGEEIAIEWKIDSFRNAGDPEYLDFNEFLISAKSLAPINTGNQDVTFLWRETVYVEEYGSDISQLVINEHYISNISEPEKAALAYAATFIGNECEWDGNVTEERDNLKCKIISALSLDYQCSPDHLDFLRHWFRSDDTILDELNSCPTIPDGSTIQSTFDEIKIEVNGNYITTFFKVSGINLRDGETWDWTEKHYFKISENELLLLSKDVSPTNHSTINEVAMTKAYVKKDGSILLAADMKKDHRIFGYKEKDILSEKMILLSIFTDDVEENPFGCKYGAYYDTNDMTDLALKYVATEGDFMRIGIIQNGNPIDEVYMLQEWFEFE